MTIPNGLGKRGRRNKPQVFYPALSEKKYTILTVKKGRLDMKKVFAMLLALAMMFSLAACGGETGQGQDSSANPPAQSADGDKSGDGAAPAGDAQYVIKLCHEQVDGDPIDDGCDKWAELVAEKTNGAVTIEVYPSSQLGVKADLIEMMLMGQNVCTIADGSYLMDYVPDFGVVMGPFLFTDWAAMEKITASDWWAQQAELLRGEGLEIISTNWIYGERQLMTKSPVTSLADIKGQKIRVPNNDISVTMFNNLGAASTPMALSDVYTSLQTGVVDGVENPLTTLYNNAFQEVCKNVTMTNHQMTFSNFIVGADFWNTIPAEHQQTILDCGAEAALYNNELYQKVSQDMQKALEDAGCTIYTLDDAALEEFKAASVQLYRDYESSGTWTTGVYDQIQSIING